MRRLVRVVTSEESAARDAAAIAAGIPSRALMQRAGAAAAGEIALRYAAELASGVLVLAGPGNNGGDAWVAARALAASGTRVRVVEPVEAKTDDARAERALARETLDGAAIVAWSGDGSLDRGERIVVDGLLGTGATGEPHGAIASAIRHVAELRARGAQVVALDVPSGVNASTGAAANAVTADLTLTFGTVKRGQLVSRGHCGAIAVLDIGLGRHAQLTDDAPFLADERWVSAQIPAIDAEAHKGIRKKLVVVGGAEGMAGAALLAARAALRSGIGMVKVVVAQASMAAVQEAEALALAAPWPTDPMGVDNAICSWADAVVVGPGLGRAKESRTLVERVLTRWKGPVLLDADALNVFAGDTQALASLIGKREAIITPHAVEFSRLFHVDAKAVLAQRFDVGANAARTLGATVLLKGVPTIVTGPDGRRMVSAAGTPLLASAGSGDVLSGIAGTLLAQLGDAFVAGAAGAWVHGHAAELAASTVRGATLDDLLAALRDSWRLEAQPTRYPLLAELPAVGDAR